MVVESIHLSKYRFISIRVEGNSAQYSDYVLREPKMAKALIVTHGNDLEFLNIILNMVESYNRSGIKVEVLNMSSVVRKQDAYNRSILKCAFIESPEVPVFKFLVESGVPVYDANEYVGSVAAELPSIEIKESIDESIKSTLISMAGAEIPRINRRYKKFRSFFLNEAERTFQTILNVTSTHGPYQEINVVNGRFPYQRAVQEAAKFMKIRAMSFERGTYDHGLPLGLSTLDRYVRGSNYWHEDFPTTNRVIRQKEILQRTQSNDTFSRNQKAQFWIDARRKPGGSNQFNENWTQKSVNEKEYVVFFSSSTDEFAELGPEWKEAEWEDQWKAFAELIPMLNRLGYETILRIHPNLRNKHKSERTIVKAVVKDFQLEFPYLKIVLPSSNIDSYALVENAKAVIVWNSTIGLESSLMGIPTACLSSCEYDLVADVHRWLRKEDVNLSKLFETQVDTAGAAIFVTGMYLFDKPLTPLLPRTKLRLKQYGKGLPLFANRWAFRGNNRPINLMSILLPRRLFLRVRKVVRKMSLYKR